MDFSEENIQQEQTIKEPAYNVGSLVVPPLCENFANPIVNVTSSFIKLVESINFDNVVRWNNIIAQTAEKVVDSIIGIVPPIVESLYKHVETIINLFHKIDYSPLVKIAELLQGIDFDAFQKKFESVYYEALFQAKWFPHAICTEKLKLFENIADVIGRTRTGSQSRTKKLDKIIFDFYNKSRLNEFKRNWRKTNISSHEKRILCEAIDAYSDKHYALTLGALVPLWQGIIQEKVKGKQEGKNHSRTKEEFQILITENDCNNLVGYYFEEYIFYPCYKLEDVIDDTPGRNSTCHSWYKKYPTRKSALNAIIFTDFLLEMEPVKKEQSNG